MFDPIFKLALIVSIGAHVALVAPAYLFANREESVPPDVVRMNYIIIEQPHLTVEEEAYKEILEKSEEYVGKEEGNRKQSEPSEDLKTKSSVFEQVDEQKKSKAKGSEIEEAALLQYHNLIREKIKARLHSARYVSEGKEINITFTILPDGRLLEIGNENSTSGAARFRQKAIYGIKSASPFPAFPPEMGIDPITFSLNIKFATK
jgi:TonB family protein